MYDRLPKTVEDIFLTKYFKYVRMKNECKLVDSQFL